MSCSYITFCVFGLTVLSFCFDLSFVVNAVVIVDEEDEEIDEPDDNEMDLVCEIDPESPPPWTFYGDGDEDIDCDDDIDDQEDTALLRTSAANTEIVITPMSPVCFRILTISISSSLFFFLSKITK